MEIRQLEMLIAVVEQKGYLNAGEHMHVAHSAIHRQIRLLEEELGQKLFLRTGRRVQLTEAGKLLIQFAIRVEQEVKAIEQQIKDMGELAGGELRIGTGTTTLIYFLPEILNEFRARYPRVNLKIITGTADQLVRELQDGNIDLGLVSEPREDWPREKNLLYERLYEEEFSLAVSKQNGLAKRDVIAWSDLHDVPIITFPQGSRIRRIIDKCFLDAGVPQRVVMELENEEAIGSMIHLNFGAGFIASRRIESCGLHRIDVGDNKVLLGVAGVRDKSYVPRRVEEFLNICHHYAAAAHSSSAQ